MSTLRNITLQVGELYNFTKPTGQAELLLCERSGKGVALVDGSGNRLGNRNFYDGKHAYKEVPSATVRFRVLMPDIWANAIRPVAVHPLHLLRILEAEAELHMLKLRRERLKSELTNMSER